MRITASMKEEMMYALSHARGYADIFDLVQRDRERAKRIKEQCIVDDFLDARYRGASPFLRVESCEPPLPDCVGIYKAGGKIGFEATELVDPRMVQWHKNALNATRWKDYSADDLFSGVVQRLARKNHRLQAAKTAIQEADVHKVIVIIHCDEPDLIQRATFCREVFGSREFLSFSAIDEAYLLLPCPRKKHLYDEEAEFCQLVPIPLIKS